MNRYNDDPFEHVEQDDFERCEASEWFRSNDIFEGFSPGEIRIDSQRFETIKSQFENMEILSREDSMRKIKRKVDKAK